MDLINAREAWKVLAQKMFLRVCAIIDPDTLATIFSSNSKITILEVPNKETKVEHELQDGLKQLIVRCEKVVTIKFSFDEAEFDAGKKATITSGGHLKLSALHFNQKSFFFETLSDNKDIEIIELY